MSTPTRDELAERAVACKHWQWLAGMAVLNPDMPNIWYPRIGGERTPQHRFLLPRLSDPATLGCLLTLVRDAHRDAYAYASFHDDGWGVFDWGDLLIAEGRSEQEALVKALEAAP